MIPPNNKYLLTYLSHVRFSTIYHLFGLPRTIPWLKLLRVLLSLAPKKLLRADVSAFMEEQLEISKRGVSKAAINLTSKDLLIDYMEFILGSPLVPPPLSTPPLILTPIYINNHFFLFLKPYICTH